MDVRVGLERKLSVKELILLNYGVGEDLRVPWTSRRSSQSIIKEISPEYSLKGLKLKLKLQYLGTWCEEPTHLKTPWCWERLRAGGERDGRGWDSWVASLTRWTQVWVNSRSWWWTGKPGVLQSMGWQRVGHDWATKLNWTASQVSSEELGVGMDVRKCKRQHQLHLQPIKEKEGLRKRKSKSSIWPQIDENTPESTLDSREIKPVNLTSTLNTHWKDWCWSWSFNTLATWCQQPTHWKRLWCWERLRAGGGNDRWWDGWMTSLTQGTWTWANSRIWGGTGKLSVLPFDGSCRVWHDLATEQRTGEMHVKKMILVSLDPYIFPYKRVLNPLMHDIWFSLINNNLLIIRLPAPCYKTSI